VNLAIAVLGALNLAQVAERWHVIDRVADRVRVVNPVREAAKKEDPPAGNGQLQSILGGHSHGEMT
jgi:hypothetical protein